MKTNARYWEEQFYDLMSYGRTRQYRERLQWFLFKLHLAIQTTERQSDGSTLLIFDDGSVFGEESDLDALLSLAPRRNFSRNHANTRFARSEKKRERCREQVKHVIGDSADRFNNKSGT